MSKLRDLSIKRKLTIIILLTTCLVLLVTSTVFVFTELVSFRRGMVHNISTLAEVIGINSTAALTFQDSQTAREILAGLGAEPHVMAACIYRKNGDVFATYKKNERPSFISPDRNVDELGLFEADLKFSEITEEGFRFSNEFLEAVRPIILNGKLIGHVRICSDLEALHSRLKWFVGTVAGVMLVCLFLAYLMSSRLQRIISGPISTLAQTMTIVSSKRDYTVRARKHGRDEIGVLIDGFNSMIGQIQREIEERKRAEEALQKAHDQLEQRVEDRTAELVKINDELKREIEERKRIETELLEKQEALRAQHISTVRKSIELSDMKRELEDKNYDLELSSTELEKAMEELQKARDELEMRVEKRTRELEKANEELQTEINERKQVEEALRENREQLRATLESTGDGILVVNQQGRVTHTNTRFADMWRIPTELIKTQDDDKLLNYVLDQLQEPEAFLSKVQELYRSPREDNDTLFFKDGRVFERYSCPLIRDERIDGRVWSFRDLTERKRMEEERETLQSHLRRAEKMEALGTLAGGVAHDLNNILSGLVSYPELLLMELGEDSPLTRPILTIQNSGKKAAAIVQDLLTLARRGVSVTEVVNLNDIISDYFHTPEYNKLQAFHSSVRFETNLETDLLNTMGSSIHLSKTVMNLIANAAEALPDGGTVTISTRNQYVDKPIRGYDEVKEGDYVVLSIADNGIGIPAEDLERIFEPFYTKKKMGKSGTGLGMAVVWGTVKDHNGYVDVQSTVGKGSTFYIYFPVTRKEAEQRKMGTSMQEYMGHGETILVVDDVHEQREIASVMLSKLGYAVNVVSSGEEAVDYMKTNSADLLVIDMIMDPGIDGLETYQRILELHPGQKAIIASGYSETDRVREAQRLGAGPYIKKPYTLETLGLTVKTEIEK